MKILNKLYFGEINPHALKINDNNFEKLLKLMSESEESLIKQLTEEQKILFEKIRDCDSEISDITERSIFGKSDLPDNIRITAVGKRSSFASGRL